MAIVQGKRNKIHDLIFFAWNGCLPVIHGLKEPSTVGLRDFILSTSVTLS